MPSSRLPGFPTTHPSFLSHRNNDRSRPLTLKISLSVPSPLLAWASLPTPPMSGTPPPEPPSDPSQLAGRRRKREDTPPVTSQETTPATISSINISPLVEQIARRHGDSARTSGMSNQPITQPDLPSPWDSGPSYGSAANAPYSQYVGSSAVPSTQQQQQASPRATRKGGTKGHVASACVNCKRKHLRCESQRPCRRCIQSGKEESCRDVEHKKRGRPPLRPDESSASRPIGAGVSLPPLVSSSGRPGPGPGLIPLLPNPTASRSLYTPQYAAPSISQTYATAQGQFSTPYRPLSFPPAQPPPNIPPRGPHPTGSSYPIVAAGPPTGGYATEYPNPLFPRHTIPSQHHIGQMQGYYGPNPLQLPPILPAPPGATIDPVFGQQQRFYPQQQQQPLAQTTQSRPGGARPEGGETEERDAKRPRMDIRGMLGPRE